MITYATHRYLYWVSSALIFALLASLMASEPQNMFGDSDVLWHIAAGDLIRQLGHVPLSDPFSFTAGDYRWLNMAWLWDAVFSYAYEKLGWHGPVALNAIIIASVYAVVFAHSLLRCSNNLIPIVLCLLGLLLILDGLLRPLQITTLMTAIWMLLLGIVARNEAQLKWLAILPLLMLIWVNCHGGFVVGGVLLVAFFAQSLYEKNKKLSKALFITGLATGVAMLCNPYGLQIIEAVWRPMTTDANRFISEWQPMSLSRDQLFYHALAVAFILTVPRNKTLPILGCERWLAYFWLLMAVTSIRHMNVFSVIALPIVACALETYFKPKNQAANAKATAMIDMVFAWLNRRAVAMASLISCLALSVWLVSPLGAAAYQTKIKLPTLASEIAFIKENHPEARLLTYFNLASFVIFETRGEVLVFADPRTDTAIPPAVMQDYTRFELQEKGWEDMFDRYKLDGVMLPNDKQSPTATPLLDRFRHRHDWVLAYEGPLANIYLRRK
ncbi:MAG: hypothetical protein LW823_03240 [Rickettsiales bacterium]|jgi:hypothetical protein|nr:hypothetical protein [Rickettsiales bacterium]